MKTRKKAILLIIVLILVAIIYLRYGYKIPENSGQAEVSWDKMEGENVAGYKIYYGNAPRNGNCPPGGYEEKIDVGMKNQYKFDDLTAGSTYYFSVVSYNADKKESCFSGEVKKEIRESILAKIAKKIK